MPPLLHRTRHRIPAFTLHRPATAEEAVDLLASHDGNVAPMAGGIDMINRMKFGKGPGHVVHLGRIDSLRAVAADGDTLVIGAGVTHQTLGTLPLIGELLPDLAGVAKLLGNVRVRIKGTIGGNLMAREAAYDLAPALAALGAELELRSMRGKRRIPSENLLTVAPDELLVAVHVPQAKGRRLIHDRSLRPTITCAVGRRTAADFWLAVGNAGKAPIVIQLESSAKQVEAAMLDALPLPTDLHGSAGYRRRMVGVLTKRALKNLEAVA